MNSKYGVIVVAILACLVSVGCSPTQTLERAGDFQKIGEETQTASEKVQSILDRYPADTIEDNELARMIVEALPDDWQAQYRQAVAIADDARTAAHDIVAALSATSEDSFIEADKLRVQAASEADKWSNFRAVAESAISVALAPEGVVMVGLGLLAGFFRKKQVAAQAESNQNKEIASNLVRGVEVLKATPAGREVWENGGRAIVAKSQSSETIDYVRSVKNGGDSNWDIVSIKTPVGGMVSTAPDIYGNNS